MSTKRSSRGSLKNTSRSESDISSNIFHFFFSRIKKSMGIHGRISLGCLSEYSQVFLKKLDAIFFPAIHIVIPSEGLPGPRKTILLRFYTGALQEIFARISLLFFRFFFFRNSSRISTMLFLRIL